MKSFWTAGLCTVLVGAVLVGFRGYLLGFEDQAKKPRDSLLSDLAGGIHKLRGEGAMPETVHGIRRLLFTQSQPLDPSLPARGALTAEHYLRQVKKATDDRYETYLTLDTGWGLVKSLQKQLKGSLSLGRILDEMETHKSWRRYLYEDPDPPAPTAQPDRLAAKKSQNR